MNRRMRFRLRGRHGSGFIGADLLDRSAHAHGIDRWIDRVGVSIYGRMYMELTTLNGGEIKHVEVLSTCGTRKSLLPWPFGVKR